jgi:hypothetical protein
MDLTYDQCMLNWTDKNGNTHISFKTCPEGQICQTLEDKSMGFCYINIKTVYPGEKCYYISQCSSRKCINEYCLGFDFKEFCNPQKRECDQNLNCRKQYNESAYFEKEIYRCSNLSNVGEECNENNDCELNLVCAWTKDLSKNIILNNTKNFTINNTQQYLSYEEYLNLTQYKNKTCIERASLQNGIISSEIMGCESGDMLEVELYEDVKVRMCVEREKILKDCNESHKCLVEVDLGFFGKLELEEECVDTNLGNLTCPLDQKEKAWKNYLEKYYKYIIKENLNKKRIKKEIHIPYDKDDLKNSELSEAYWRYYDWEHTLEADECVTEYYFINNKSQYLVILNIYVYLLFFFIF